MSSKAIYHINGIELGATGYGLLSLTKPWDPMPHAAGIDIMKAALEKGANFWNGGMFYGTPDNNSLHVVHDYFKKYPDDASKVVFSIKGAYNSATHQPDGSPAGIRSSVEEALRVLNGTKKIDIFEMTRIDREVDIEISMTTLKELVHEGKIGGIGLSEVNAATIRRAHKVHPLLMVENELSLFSTKDLENGVVNTCHELGIAYIAYSPLSRGFLTNSIKSFDDLPINDFRRLSPRFQPNVFDSNLRIVDAVAAIAKFKGGGITVAQVALAWVRAQGAIPIFSATTVERIEENTKEIELDSHDLLQIEELLRGSEVQGDRYPAMLAKYLSL